MDRPGGGRRDPSRGRAGSSSTRAARRARQQAIREVIAGDEIGSQQQLAERLGQLGFEATQATVSRDIAELGLFKVVRGGRHVYASPADLGAPAAADDAMLRRVLGDVSIEVRRSGLILLLVSTPGTASIIAEAIDRSTLDDQVGTLAGDNTVLVLFADEAGLERWRRRLQALRPGAAGDA